MSFELQLLGKAHQKDRIILSRCSLRALFEGYAKLHSSVPIGYDCSLSRAYRLQGLFRRANRDCSRIACAQFIASFLGSPTFYVYCLYLAAFMRVLFLMHLIILSGKLLVQF